jgi:hypothetical protein
MLPNNRRVVLGRLANLSFVAYLSFYVGVMAGVIFGDEIGSMVAFLWVLR